MGCEDRETRGHRRQAGERAREDAEDREAVWLPHREPETRRGGGHWRGWNLLARGTGFPVCAQALDSGQPHLLEVQRREPARPPQGLRGRLPRGTPDEARRGSAQKPLEDPAPDGRQRRRETVYISYPGHL